MSMQSMGGSYKEYKARIYKKRLDKIEKLISSIQETSLKDGDKVTLKNKIYKRVKELTQ